MGRSVASRFDVVHDTGSVTYSFRWPLAFPVGPRLPFRTSEWLLLAGDAWQIRLVPEGSSETLYASKRPVLVGHGFPSAELAEAGAKQARTALERIFAAFGIGAYFDGRARGSLNFSQAFVHQTLEDTGQVIAPDNAGLTVYLTDPATVFFGFSAEVRVDVPAELLNAALASPAAWTDKSDEELVAYSIYTAAAAAGSEEARFLMLVMAVEVLAEVRPRPGAVRAHVDAMVQMTKEAAMTDDERTPLVSALNNLRDESVGSACRRYLNERLGQRTYRDMSPGAFFGRCYGIRSGLTHGGKRSEPGDLGEWLNPLQELVGDLLAGTDLATWRDEERRVRFGS